MKFPDSLKIVSVQSNEERTSYTSMCLDGGLFSTVAGTVPLPVGGGSLFTISSGTSHKAQFRLKVEQSLAFVTDLLFQTTNHSERRAILAQISAKVRQSDAPSIIIMCPRDYETDLVEMDIRIVQRRMKFIHLNIERKETLGSHVKVIEDKDISVLPALLVRSEGASDTVMASDFIQRVFAGEWGPPFPTACLLADFHGQTCGAILVTESDQGPLIAHLFVDPHSQGAGLGGELIRYALQEVRPNNLLAYVNCENEKTIRLLGRMGFLQIGPELILGYLPLLPIKG